MAAITAGIDRNEEITLPMYTNKFTYFLTSLHYTIASRGYEILKYVEIAETCTAASFVAKRQMQLMPFIHLLQQRERKRRLGTWK